MKQNSQKQPYRRNERTFILKRRLLLLLSILLFIGQVSYAQQQTKVSGVVIDKDKEPLIGVSVFTEGQNRTGVITDNKGQYTITVPSNAKLHFSYIGMQEVVEKVNGRKMINISMNEDESTTLAEVVVSVGYGQVKKRDLTGSVGQVNMTELSKAPVASVDQALAGRIAGLNIITADGSPGAESTVSIRGGGLSQDASPLFIIDGFPMENFNLNTLDPNSIESFEVLKDASSIAIYGSRGANGVIIINTKSGSQGKPKVNYEFNLSLNTRPNFVKMMNAYDYVKMQLDLDAMDNRTFSADRYLGKADEETGLRPRDLDYYITEPGTDWQKAVTRNGLTQNHSLSISGGNENTKYMLKGGYLNQDAIVKNTGLTRFSGLGKIDQKFNENVSAQFNINFTNTKTKNNQAFNRARSFFPTTGFQKIDEFIAEMEYMLAQGTLSDAGIDYGSLITPLQQAENEFDERVQNNTQIGAQLQWKILKYLTITPRAQLNHVGTEVRRYYNSKTYQGHLFKRANGTYANTNGINAYKEDDDANSYVAELLLNYKQTINKKHRVDAMYGFNYQYSELTQNFYSVLNIAPEFEYLQFYGLNAGSVKGGQSTYRGNKNQLVSSFGRLNYSFMDKYLFTATARYDGSSKLAKGHQWGFFPSAAFAWRISNEPFMKKFNFVNDAKLRLSYGQVGNNRGVNDFSYLVEFGELQNSKRYMLDGKNLSNGLFQYFLANSELTWEKTTEFDVGIDLQLFNSRLGLSFDFYNKIVDNLLMPRPAPYYLGYGNNTRYQNAGSTQSSGIELTIMSTNIQTKQFTWNTSLNLSYNQNKVRNFSQGYDVMSSQNGSFGNTQGWIAETGKSTSQFYGYKYVRLYQYSDFNKTPTGDYILKPGIPTFQSTVGGYHLQPGDPMYADLNGDGIISDADRTTLGSPIPKVTGGLSNTFTYKDLSLNIFFQYSLGGKLIDFNRITYCSTGSYNRYSNQYAEYTNHWTPENTDTDIPRMMKPNSKGDVNNISVGKISDRIVENGDYLRLATVALTYRLPKDILKKIAFQDISFTLSAQNLFVITGYKGQDPEVSSYNTYAAPKGIGYNVLTNSNTYTSMTGGFDNSPYPRAKVFNFGISVTF